MKDKTTAALLALFLGWLGVHRFYLKQPGLGILYFFLMFFFMISLVLGIIDAIVLLAMDDREFDRRYNDRYQAYGHDRYQKRAQRRDYRRPYRADRQPEQSHRRPQARTRPSRPAANRQVPERKRVNPFKQSGIKKYKDFDLEEAIIDFNKGLEIDGRDLALHFNIACAYSLTEQVEKAYYHLDKAVQLGFKDFEKIKTHDDLAYVRIQEQFDDFEANGFRLKSTPEKEEIKPEENAQPQIEAPKENLLDGDVLLSQLKRLADLRDKGLITENEFLQEKQKLMR